jgi:hypothetical protein
MFAALIDGDLSLLLRDRNATTARWCLCSSQGDGALDLTSNLELGPDMKIFTALRIPNGAMLRAALDPVVRDLFAPFCGLAKFGA